MNGRDPAPLTRVECAELLAEVAEGRRAVVRAARERKADRRSSWFMAAGMLLIAIGPFGVMAGLDWAQRPRVDIAVASSSPDIRFFAEGWFNPRWSHTMDGSRLGWERWLLGNRSFHTRDLMGRRI